MSVPEKTMDAGWRMVHEETVYEQYEATVDALMNPALGSDRLVVAGEIVQEIVLWLWTSAPVEKVWQREEIADAVRARFGA